MIDSWDVVVMGAGLAGCCAALSAREAGASVLIVEKGELPGGSTLRAAGTFAFAGTDLQREQGIEDSADALAGELRRVQGRGGDPRLVDVYARDQLWTYEWLKQQGVVFERVDLSGGQGTPRAHATRPAQVVEALWARLGSEAGVVRITGTAIDGLSREADHWVVTLKDRGAARRVSAAQVVIASGGFSRSAELLDEFAPELRGAVPISGPLNTGDGLRIGRSLGAGLVDMDYVKGTFGLPLPDHPRLPEDAPEGMALLLAIYRGAIVVNQKGRRFADESSSYKQISERCLAQPRGIGFQLFDASVMEQSVTVPSNNDFRGGLERGMVLQGATLGELAERVGVPPPALIATVVAYNDAVENGSGDEMGRSSLGGGSGKPFPLRTPPYYAIPTAVSITGTFCGLAIDTEMRVLDVSGEAIAGLYAAGEVVGGMHGESYMSGSALGKAAIFGRIAGRNAAKQRANQ